MPKVVADPASFFLKYFFAIAEQYQESSRDAEGIPKAARSR